MEKENVWSTSDVLANRNNWSLAADVELLKHLQSLSEKIFSKAASTLHSLNSFENDINQTCISIANTSNKFKALSDTQFIESKVQEESSDINEPSSSQIEPPADRGNENITVKLKEALENGFQVLDTQYDIIPVTGSDSEDDEPQEILLRARNPYLSRRLPHIIGSEEFTRNDNLGLIDSSSSEEDEEEEEDENDDDNTGDDNEEEERKDVQVDSDEESIRIQKPPSPKLELIRPRTEIITISSSDSEDSELSNPYEEGSKKEKIISSDKKMSTEKSRDNEPAQNSNSFADHLSAALKNNSRNIYNIVPPDFGDTPPPFPGKDNCISSDDGSEESDDLFATKKSTKHSISNTIHKSNYDNESDEDNHHLTKETAVISRELDASGKTLDSRKASIASKTSQHSDLANSSSVVNETSVKDVSVTPLPKPKFADSNINSINKKMVSAINAELNAKLNLKSPSIKSTENLTSAPTSTKSSESRTPVESSAKPSENNTPTKTSEQMPSTGTKKDSKKPALFDELVDEVDNENDIEDDLFRGISSVKKSTTKSKKSKGLFDDGDSIDDLFSPVKSAQNSSKKSVDLFSSESSKPAKSEKPTNELTVQPPVVDLFKNSNLFASDSDSEDDIFSIIKSQKKPATNIFKTKTDSLFENNPSDSKPTLIPSNDTPSTTPSVIKSAPTVIESSSLFTEEKIPPGNLKISAKMADSAKPSIDETNVSADVASASKNNLFESTNKKKTSEDLFHSDDDDEDDLFSKSTRIKSANEVPSPDKNTDVTKTRVQSSTTIGENIVEKKTAPEIAKNIRLDSSNESINQEENSSHIMKNTAQPDKTINIFAKFQPSKLSSSSEDEDVKQENTFIDVSQTSKNDTERTDTTLLQKKDELFNESSKHDTEDTGNVVSPPKDDIFGKYGEFSTSSKDSKDDDMFGESYGSRSAMFLPPKDDLSDDFFEDEDIKASNYLSQEDEDLFDEKMGSPPFQGVSPYKDIFGESDSTGLSSESPKNSIITDTVRVEYLFTKPTNSFLPVNLFASNNLFAEEADDLKGDEKLLGKTPSEKSLGEKLNLNPDHDNRSKKDEEIAQNDYIQKPFIPGEEKIDQVVIIPSSKSKDGLFNEPKEAELFNFTEKDLYGSDSDVFGVISVENENPILVTDNVTEAEKIEQITSSEKISSPDDFQDQNKKSDENPLDDSVSKKSSPSSKIGKINTTMFEKANTEKKLGEDVQDGNLFAKSASPEPVSATRSTPGKLAVGRGLNINVNALLPGGNRSSKMKSKQSSEPITPDEKQVVESAVAKESQDVHEQSTGLLTNVAKERPKLSGKRRPPSRKARKSRILNNDVFGDVFGDEFGTESFPEDKSSVSKDSPKLQKKVEVEKSAKAEKPIEDLFSNIENKTDDFFGISKTKEESNIKQFEATSNLQITNVSSSREESDNDLNLDINASLNPLPSLTKSRAKPQKRSLATKKPSDISPVISNEKITYEPPSKPSNEKTEIFVEKTSIPANPSKTTPPSSKSAAAKSIFDSLEDDDDDLFEIVKSKKPTEEKPAKKIIEEKPRAKAEVKVETKPESKPSQQQPKVKLTQKSTNMDIFNDDDDDEMFASAKKKLPSNKLSKKSSLFEDNDDDDLFGNKTSTSNRKTSVPDPVTSSAKTKALNEKPRIVKLRSEAVQKDPLTGKDITGPL